MAKQNKTTELKIVFMGGSNLGTDINTCSLYDIPLRGPEMDTLMEEALKSGWLHFVDIDGCEHYINLAGIEIISFE